MFCLPRKKRDVGVKSPVNPRWKAVRGWKHPEMHTVNSVRRVVRQGSFFLVAVMYILMIALRTSPAQMIVAHRGASEAAPENTLVAFNLAWKQDADAIEGDFHLTADRHIVAVHDRTTKRTSGIELEVAKSTLRQLQQLDVGQWKSARFRGQRIPTLGEVLATVPENKKILIEIKCGLEIVPELKEVLAGTNLQPRQTMVISFNEHVVAAVKRAIPHVKVFWLTSYKQDESTGIWSPQIDQVLDTLRRTGADGLDTHANPAVVDAEFIQAVREEGHELHTWTVDDPKIARHYQRLGVDSITTNRPRYIRDQLKRPSTR